MTETEKKHYLRVVIGSYEERIRQLKYEVSRINAQLSGHKAISEFDVMEGYRKANYDYDGDRDRSPRRK